MTVFVNLGLLMILFSTVACKKESGSPNTGFDCTEGQSQNNADTDDLTELEIPESSIDQEVAEETTPGQTKEEPSELEPGDDAPDDLALESVNHVNSDDGDTDDDEGDTVGEGDTVDDGVTYDEDVSDDNISVSTSEEIFRFKRAPPTCSPSEFRCCKKGMLAMKDYVGIKFISDTQEYLCDTKTDMGGWIVFQRQYKKGTKFSFKKWQHYKTGIGFYCDDNYWLGLEKLSNLLSKGDYEMRIDLKTGAQSRYALYKTFKVASEQEKFKLTIGGYSGTLPDKMSANDGAFFSTEDRDNDRITGSCSVRRLSGWWYTNCGLSNLNGRLLESNIYFGVIWGDYKASQITYVDMKIRPKD